MNIPAFFSVFRLPARILKPAMALFASFLFMSMVQQEAETTFVIKDKAVVKDLNRYIHALNKASMESYRLRDKRSVLVFEPQKVVVELLSARELVAAGSKIDIATYPSEFPKTFEMPIFSLSADGWLMARYSNDPKSKSH